MKEFDKFYKTTWFNKISNMNNNEYFNKMFNFIKKENSSKKIFPDIYDVFKSFEKTDFDEVKVVLIGQDPYYIEGHADGLSFSSKNKKTTPRSLGNIFKELESDLNIKNNSNSLENWAKQGVFLYNTSIISYEGNPNFYSKNKLFNKLTSNVFELLKEKDEIVYILLGNEAKKFETKIDGYRNLILKTSHPSPLSARRGFFGSKIFSKTNKYLKDHDKKEILWQL